MPPIRWFSWVAVLQAFISLSSSIAQENHRADSAARILPSTTVFFAEIQTPSKIVDGLLHHPAKDHLTAIPALQAALQSDDVVSMKAALSVLEAGMGMRWPAVLEALTAHGAYVAIDGRTQGAVALVHARDAEVPQRLLATVLSAVRAGKLPGSDDDPVRESKDRGTTTYCIGDDLFVATFDNWLIAANKIPLCQQVVDLHLEAGQTTLGDSASYRQVRSANIDALVWAYVDVETLRASGAAEELYSGRSDNAIAELLFGGILSNLKHTPYCQLRLDGSQDQIRLTLETPHDKSWAGEDRTYYFGAAGNAVAPELLSMKDQLLAISSYRDLSQMWLRAPDLMNDKANDDLAKADTQLTTFFSGRDFGEDILGALGPELQIVVVQQDFRHVLPRPAIRLPAFALKFRMLDAEETQPELRRVFQSFIGFLNVVGAMNGQPQFDLGLETTEKTQIVSATYVPARGEEQATDAALNFNFSPTMAFAGDLLVLASTSGLARSLVETTPKAESHWTNGLGSPTEAESAEPSSTVPNTLASLSAVAIQRLLVENRSQLVAQNMLEKGRSRQEAEAEIGVLLEVLELFQGASLALETEPSLLRLQFRVELATPQ